MDSIEGSTFGTNTQALRNQIYTRVYYQRHIEYRRRNIRNRRRQEDSDEELQIIEESKRHKKQDEYSCVPYAPLSSEKESITVVEENRLKLIQF